MLSSEHFHSRWATDSKWWNHKWVTTHDTKARHLIKCDSEWWGHDYVWSARTFWEDDIWAELTEEAGAMQTLVGLMSQFSFFHSDLTGHCILTVFYSSWQLFFGPCCFLFLEYFLQSLPVVTPQPTFEMPLPPWKGRKRRKILTDPLHQAKYHLSYPSEFSINGGYLLSFS